MKYSVIRFLILAALFVALAMGSIRQISSNSDKRQITAQAERATAKPEVDAEPLSYRSPGAAHKLLLPAEDAATENALLSSKQARRAKKYKAFTLLELSDATFANLDEATRERAQLRDDFNLILLNRGQLEPPAPEPAISAELRAPARATRG